MASISASPNSFASNTYNNNITVTGTSTHFTASTPAFQWNNSTGAITNINVISDTSATVTINTGLYVGDSYPVSTTLVDIATGDGSPSATITITLPNLGIIKWGYIGDSLFAGNGGNGADYYANNYLTSLGYTPTLINRGINGTSTLDWAPTGSNLSAAVTAILAAGCTLVHIMLGTNDVRTPNSFSLTTHNTQLRAIVSYCLAQGLTVILHKPPMTGSYAGGEWPADPNSIYCAYWALDVQMTNGINVLIGDTGVYNLSYPNMNTWTSDGIHPTTTNWQTMISMQCMAALRPYGYPALGGSGNGGPTIAWPRIGGVNTIAWPA